MMVLDTNVVSALMRAAPDRAVIAWLDGQPPESLWTTAITVFEVRFGIQALPAVKRRNALRGAFEDMLSSDLGGRVLDFDSPAAAASAEIAAKRRAAGRPVDVRDVQIAGIVVARRATLVTRNARHFEETGVGIVDPWGGGG